MCPDFQYVLERHTRIRQLALQQHYNVMIVLLQLLPLQRLAVLRITLLYVGLERSYLLVDVRNVLLDDVGEFLAMEGRVDTADEVYAQERDVR